MEWMKKAGRLRRSRGTALAEAAIVLSVLIMVTLGAIKYGWLFTKLHQTTNAAREGARHAVLPGATLPEVQAAVKLVMDAGGIPEGAYTVADPCLVDPNLTEIRVSVTVTDVSQVDLLPGFLFTPAQLNASATMAKEQ